MTPTTSQTATPKASDADVPTSIAAERVENATNAFEMQVVAAREWFAQSRFDGIVRLHTAREVAAQRARSNRTTPSPERRRKRSIPDFASCSPKASRSRPSAHIHPARL